MNISILLLLTGSRPRETRKVRFSDGLNPGVDTGRYAIPDSQSGTVPLGMEADFGPNSGFENSHQGVVQRSLIPLNEDGLPPVIIATEVKGGWYYVYYRPCDLFILCVTFTVLG